MFGSFFNQKKQPIESMLKRKGTGIKFLRDSISPTGLELLYDYIEKHHANGDFEVLHAPLTLESRAGTLEYPMVIRTMGKVVVFLIHTEKWSLSIKRSMLFRFSQIKRKFFPNSSFIILSTSQPPEKLMRFAGDNPANHFHLLNFADMIFEESHTNPLETFINNFKSAFGQQLKTDTESLKILENIIEAEIKPIPEDIIDSEPIRASLFLIQRFFQTVFIKETQSQHVPHSKVGNRRKEIDMMEHGKNSFHIDFSGKTHWDLTQTEPASLVNFIHQIRQCLEKCNYIPDRTAFPFFRWLKTPRPSESRDTHGLREIVRQINNRRLQNLTQHPEQSELEAYQAFYCPRCNDLFTNQIPLTPFPALSLDSIIEHTHRHASYKGKQDAPAVTCQKCMLQISFAYLGYAQLCRFFPDVNRDLHYSLTRTREGKLAGSWSILSQEGKSRFLGTEIDNETIPVYFSRHLSVAVLWKDLFRNVIKTQETEMCTVEKYYRIIVSSRINDTTDHKREEISKELYQSGKLYRTWSLAEKTEERKIKKIFTYRDWLPEYSHLISENLYQAEVLIDTETFTEHLKNSLRKFSITCLPIKKTLFFIFREKIKQKIDIAEMIDELIIGAEHPEEFIHRKLRLILNKFDNIDTLAELAKKITGPDHEVDYKMEEDTLYVVRTGDSRPWKIGVEDIIKKFGTEKKELDRALRMVLITADKTADRCACGKDAHITLRLKSAQWLKDLAEFEDSPIIAQEWGENYLVFYRQCEDHTEYITRKALDEWGLTFETIKANYAESLSRNIFKVRIFTSTQQGHPMMGVVGEDAASILLEPAWLAGIIQEVPYILPRVPRLYAPTTGALIISPENTPDDILHEFSQKLVIAQQAFFGMSEPLEVAMNVTLPEKGEGRFIISYTGEI